MGAHRVREAAEALRRAADALDALALPEIRPVKPRMRRARPLAVAPAPQQPTEVEIAQAKRLARRMGLEVKKP